MTRMDRIRHVKGSKPKRRAPRTLMEWHRLLTKVIARAKQLRDRRLAGLEALMANQSRISVVLKKMSIICEADILREFPDP